MKRAMVLILAVFAITCFSAPVMAIGVGGSFSAGVARVYWINSSATGKGSGYAYGGSILFDTAVAQNSLFNYRANFAIQAIDGDTKNDDNGNIKNETEGMRYSLWNSFGFGVVRTESIRFWLGPQFGIHYVDADTTRTEPDFMPMLYGASYILMPTESKTKKSDNGGGASLGLVLGLNINMGSVFTLGLDGGVRAFVTSNEVVANAGPEGFINVSFIFRINDNF